MICQTAPVCGQLNAFQKVMLQWSSLHPYNAAHVYKIAGPLRSSDLVEAVETTFRCHGLGIAHLSADGQMFRHETAIQPEVELLVGGDDPESTVKGHLGHALNRSFERPTMHPFRFAAIDASPQSHYVVLAYDHWIADAHAARLVLRSVLGRYLPLAIPESQERLELYPGTYREVFRRRLHGGQLALAALRAITQWNRNRSAWRVACWSNTQWEIDYRLYHTIPGTVARLREFARANGATVNDVLLAAFGRALAEVMPSRGRQNGLALGSIVDTRSIADEDLSRALGAFLGYYLVRSNPGATQGLDEVTRQIAARTHPIKTQHRYMDSLVNMQLINTVWPWLSTTTRRHFMRKSLPMSGGMSNVVIRDAWMNDHRDVILDYHRGVSTGPTMPIVLSPTTFGDHLNVGVSYRVAGFSRAKIDALMEMFRDQIEHPNKASRGELRRVPAAKPATEPISPRLQKAMTPVAES
ncbi:MAG: condensation domain-containing protein [Thermoguttaceae bacterium]|jgi:NRPS condensation-like uncharacterized protein